MRHPETSPISTPAMGGLLFVKMPILKIWLTTKTKVMELTEKSVDKKNMGEICFVIVAQAFLGGVTNGKNGQPFTEGLY